MKPLSLLLCLLIVGCQQKPAPVPAAAIATPPANVVEERPPMDQLVTICKRLHLSYRIVCFPSVGCNATAWHVGDEEEGYWNGRWIGHGSEPSLAVRNLDGLLEGGADPEKHSQDVTPDPTFDTGDHTP